MSDPFGRDEIGIKLNGVLMQDKLTMRPNEVVNFGPRMTFAFEHEAVIEFTEGNVHGEHEVLGDVRVDESNIGSGPLLVTLTHKTALYEVRFEVVAA